MVEHKLNKNARWSSKKMYDGRAGVKQKMQAGRAKHSTMVEQKLKRKTKDGRAKKCKAQMQGGRAKK
jgi:hypothetical protein